MLARAAEEERRAGRGRLKVFLGMAPGVGKTFAMLREAQKQRQAGVDVVIGWVEPHGRPETEALTVGLPRLPPRAATLGDLRLSDLDLDAALARRPALLLVDELAHTNAPGGRHARRWNDVLELVEAGIGVATTLNVQHVESLNDVVAQITGVVVRETVPDSVLERADEIELVDVTPDELIRRLEAGKVYAPEQGRRALESFFRRGNLIALRELALRRAAERVDAEVDAWRRAHGIERPWPTSDRLMVAVSPAPQSANLVRAAARMALRLRAPWLAVSVEPASAPGPGEAARQRVAAHLALADRLGAETLVVQGDDVAAQLLAVARERNVTRLVVGKPPQGRWPSRLRRTLVERLVVQSSGTDVLVTTGEAESPAPPAPRPPGPPTPRAAWALAVALVAAATGVGALVHGRLALADQAMLYLLAILLAAVRLPRGPALLTTLLSVLALDFFFVPPFLSIAVADGRYLLTFAVQLGVGLTVMALTARLRSQAAGTAERERRTAGLYGLSRALAQATRPEEVAVVLSAHASQVAGAPTAVGLADGPGGLAFPGASAAPDPVERGVALWALENGRPAGRGTDTLPAAPCLALPLVGRQRTLGVVCVRLAASGGALGAGPRQLLDAALAQGALALERTVVAGEAERERVAAEHERTRNALLAGVSHDLRTPLTAIAGAADALLDGSLALPEDSRRELLLTLREDAQRMSRLVDDLLQLARLDAGALAVRKEWHAVESLVGDALRHADPALDGRPVTIDLGPGLLLVPADEALIVQVLVNLLENAGRHTPPGTPVTVRARGGPSEVTLEVEDRGPGIPPGDLPRLFERFYRGADARPSPGSGLGLALARAIVSAHGGTIEAFNAGPQGACFRLRLPLAGVERPAPAPADEEAV